MEALVDQATIEVQGRLVWAGRAGQASSFFIHPTEEEDNSGVGFSSLSGDYAVID
jgi:hypothetical protein